MSEDAEFGPLLIICLPGQTLCSPNLLSFLSLQP